MRESVRTLDDRNELQHVERCGTTHAVHSDPVNVQTSKCQGKSTP